MLPLLQPPWYKGQWSGSTYVMDTASLTGILFISSIHILTVLLAGVTVICFAFLRNDTKEDVFVHQVKRDLNLVTADLFWWLLLSFFPQTAIKKNNPRKFLRSVGDGEVVEFDVIEAVKVSTSNLNLFKKKKKTRMEDFFSPNIALLNVTLNSRKRVHEKWLVQQERGWQRGQMKWRKQVSAKNEMTKKSEGKNE